MEKENKANSHSHPKNPSSPHKSQEKQEEKQIEPQENKEHEKDRIKEEKYNESKENGKEKETKGKLREEEYKEMLQRLQAEFENFRKRSEKENEEFRKFAGARMVSEFLPVLDSVKGGIEQAEKSNNKEMKEGFESVLKQLLKILERNGVKKIESTGKKFDHNLHEVLMTGKEEEKDEDIILEELQPGYLMNEKVLRPAKVKVNKK